MTQEQLAGRLGVKKGTVSRWEKGRRGVDLNVLAAIAEALGRNLNDLFSPPVPKVRSEVIDPNIAAIAAEVAKLLQKGRRSR